MYVYVVQNAEFLGLMFFWYRFVPILIYGVCYDATENSADVHSQAAARTGAGKKHGTEPNQMIKG